MTASHPQEASHPLLRATKLLLRDTWRDEPVDCVLLAFDDRHRRRLRMEGVRGTAFLLDLAEATLLRGGDALVLDNGALVEVVSAPETLIEISSSSAISLVRIAWHLGNRHLPLQIFNDKIRIRRDHIIEEMVCGLGGRLRAIEAPFDPEGGAYTNVSHDPGAAHHHHG